MNGGEQWERKRTIENGTKMKKYLAYAFGEATKQIHIHSFVQEIFISIYIEREAWTLLLVWVWETRQRARERERDRCERKFPPPSDLSDVAIKSGDTHTHTLTQYSSGHNLENSRIVENRIHIQSAFKCSSQRTKPIYTHSKMTSTFQNAQEKRPHTDRPMLVYECKYRENRHPVCAFI